jgi:hypothetical protein
LAKALSETALEALKQSRQLMASIREAHTLLSGLDTPEALACCEKLGECIDRFDRNNPGSTWKF